MLVTLSLVEFIAMYVFYNCYYRLKCKDANIVKSKKSTLLEKLKVMFYCIEENKIRLVIATILSLITNALIFTTMYYHTDLKGIMMSLLLSSLCCGMITDLIYSEVPYLIQAVLILSSAGLFILNKGYTNINNIVVIMIAGIFFFIVCYKEKMGWADFIAYIAIILVLDTYRFIIFILVSNVMALVFSLIRSKGIDLKLEIPMFPMFLISFLGLQIISVIGEVFI